MSITYVQYVILSRETFKYLFLPLTSILLFHCPTSPIIINKHISCLCCVFVNLINHMVDAYFLQRISTKHMVFYGFQVVGSESIDGVDRATQITKFIEGYREGKTIQKRTSGPSLLRVIHRSFDIRVVYIFVFVVAVLMVIQTLYKGDDDYHRVPSQDQGDRARGSVLEAESQQYKPGDKQD